MSGGMTLPCGCRFDLDVIDGVNTFIHTACAAGLDCPYTRYVIEESQRQGHAATVIDAGTPSSEKAV